ncbi:MAG: hypothetical protein QOD05_4, partial [Microbacteriaceae bacterium]|nr:hypothetical protein [Microbacteriaceae bacterium]
GIIRDTTPSLPHQSTTGQETR